jgi:hypothetical protein
LPIDLKGLTDALEQLLGRNRLLPEVDRRGPYPASDRRAGEAGLLRLTDVVLAGFAGVVTADWIVYGMGRCYGAEIVGHPRLGRPPRGTPHRCRARRGDATPALKIGAFGLCLMGGPATVVGATATVGVWRAGSLSDIAVAIRSA